MGTVYSLDRNRSNAMDIWQFAFGRIFENLAANSGPVTLTPDLSGLQVSAGGEVLARLVEGLGGIDAYAWGGAHLAHIHQDALGDLHARGFDGTPEFRAHEHGGGFSAYDGAGMYDGGARVDELGNMYMHDAQGLEYGELHPDHGAFQLELPQVDADFDMGGFDMGGFDVGDFDVGGLDAGLADIDFGAFDPSIFDL